MAARNHYRYLQYDSYEPFVQVRNSTIENGESRQRTHYFHCNQISIPREMTDKDGNFLWFGNYNGWCHLKENEWVYKNVHQTFRLQNQYVDRETGLQYNFFRDYKPERVGLWIRTRLGWQVVVTCISLRLMYWDGLILLVRLERKLLILHVILNTSFDYWLDSTNVKKCLRQGLNWMRIQLRV